jgi:membrane-associated phospholipid phosphatase
LLRLKFDQVKDIITVSYQLLVLLAIFFHYSQIENALILLLMHLAIIVFVFSLTKVGDNAPLKLLKTFYPIAIIPINFLVLSYLVHIIHPVDLDKTMIAIDNCLFGCHPTVWLESFAFPVLTEYLQLIYASFYFLPIILGALLYIGKKYDNCRFFIFVIVLGFYLSYIGYFIFPAIGPRFMLDHYQHGPLSGLLLAEPIRNILNNIENIQRDCFPSGHTEIAALTLIFAYKYHKPYFYIMMVVATSLIFSTVYLRYHYVIDVIAGIVLAVIVYYLAGPLYRYLKPKTTD